MKSKTKVTIRPKAAILAILKHIEYEPWYALAEFVDNAVDSYLKNESKLKQADEKGFQLKVDIEIIIFHLNLMPPLGLHVVKKCGKV